MSVHAITAVFDHSASTGAARLVLLAMADEASREGYVTAYRRSQSWFAQKANVDDRTVRRAITALVELGEVEVITVGDGRKQADYRLLLPGLGEGTPPAPTPPKPAAGREGDSPALGRAHGPAREGTPPAPSSPSSPLTPNPLSNSREQLTLVGGETPAAPRATHLAVGQNLGTDRDLAFVAFWERYPHKTGKGQARRAWASARRKGVAPEVIIRGVERYRDDPNRQPGFTRNPATWLNGEGWLDEPEPDRRPTAPSGGGRMAESNRLLLDRARPGRVGQLGAGS